MFPAPLLKALALVLSALVSLVPSVAPAGLFPERAHVADLSGSAGETHTAFGGSVTVDPDLGLAPEVEEDPVPEADARADAAAEGNVSENASALPPPPKKEMPKARPAPPPPPFAARLAESNVPVVAGGLAPVAIVVENTYQWDLSILVALRDVTPGWKGSVGAERLDLAPGDKVEVPAHLEAPADATPGSTGRMRVDFSTPLPAVVLSVVATAKVPVPTITRDVSIYNGEGNKYIAPGQSVNFTLNVANLGDAADGVRLELTDSGRPGWSATLSATQLALEPGATKSVVLTVQSPSNAAGGEFAFFNVTARSVADATVATRASTLTYVDGASGGLPIDVGRICLPDPQTGIVKRICADLEPWLDLLRPVVPR